VSCEGFRFSDLILRHPLLCYDAQVEEIDYSFFVDIAGRGGSAHRISNFF
jgi:hypothetical protein